MATTLTSRGKQYLGAGMIVEYGDYTTDGSTTATITVSGGYVIGIEFFDANQNVLDTATGNTVTLSARSTSGGITTYTLTPGGSSVTGGTYRIMHGGQ